MSLDEKNCPLPRRLKEVRETANISQTKLGIAVGVDQFGASPRMNQYERGVHTPDYDTLSRIAETLNAPVSFFYAPNDKMAMHILTMHRMSKSKQEKVMQFTEKLEHE